MLVLLLALNGITEAFLFSVISPQQMPRYNACLTGFSLLYTFAIAATVRFGAVGLIVANGVNMLIRIVYSVSFIHFYFLPHNACNRLWVRAALPSPQLSVVLGVCFLCTAHSYALLGVERAESHWTFVVHVGVGAAMLAILAAVGYHTEKAFLKDVREIWSHHAEPAHATLTSRTTEEEEEHAKVD